MKRLHRLRIMLCIGGKKIKNKNKKVIAILEKTCYIKTVLNVMYDRGAGFKSIMAEKAGQPP